jgi:hypothetical protein
VRPGWVNYLKTGWVISVKRGWVISLKNQALRWVISLKIHTLAAIYVASEVGAISLDTKTLLIISAVILIADIILFFLSTKTFQREEILTKWT